MRVAGVLMLLGSAGCAVWLAVQNRNVMIRARVGHLVWTGHLYMVLIFGALLAAWFLLGIAFLTGRRRPKRRPARRHASGPARRTPPPATRQTPPPATQQHPYSQPYAQPYQPSYQPTSEYRPGDSSLHAQARVRAPSR